MELSDIRAKIDAVDGQLLQLFLERMDLAEEVAAYKNEHHLPILNKERERAVLAKVTANAGSRERYAYHLFSTLFELARSRQAELIDAPTKVGAQVRACLENRDQLFPQTGLVACQGVEGANSQAACDRLFPRGSIMYVKTFDAVVSAVEAGFCRFGVLPIENSSNGSVRAVYELLQEHSLTIVRSTRLCIRHELLALPGVKLEDVTEIYSHQQAIGQCSRFLEGLKGVKVIPCDNTAAAAKLVAESGNRRAAAISSHACAALYGLECIGGQIQNSDNNYTRFICVAKDQAGVLPGGGERLRVHLLHRAGGGPPGPQRPGVPGGDGAELRPVPLPGELRGSVRVWKRFTAFWAGPWATAGPRPFTKPWAVRATASLSWSRESWRASSARRTSAG